MAEREKAPAAPTKRRPRPPAKAPAAPTKRRPRPPAKAPAAPTKRRPRPPAKAPAAPAKARAARAKSGAPPAGARRTGEDLPRVEVESRAALRAWLEDNHRTAASVWLVLWKKPSPRHVPWPEIVDEALCFGFIDSLPRKLDDERTMLRLSPRSDRSAWSAVNKAKVARLVAEGRMRPAGLAAVERAKANGTWGALDDASRLAVPDDLRAALDARPPAASHFASFPPSARRGILEWVAAAKRPETRAKRVLETATLAQKNVRANQWR